MKTVKCAIYVRKSTEKGLDMEFNSLHNQEDACRAYIASQAFQGWEHARTYTDGGISGGTMERPALRELMADMARGLINVVVVYKVDRLSRSIMDFHNMMREFEKYKCNFVSITQSFDTSNSMGKLTLNMLLSFAQFEREVSSERVRDKISASKAKGLWTGGVPPLGYDIIDKKLVVNETEAAKVKRIFESYLEINSIVELARELPGMKIFAKQWTTACGKTKGGRPISATSLQRILKDKVYIGMVTHKRNGTEARGEHAPIITTELFERIATRMAENASGKSGASMPSPNLLSGKVFDANGNKFRNQRTAKSRKHARTYYASRGFYMPAPQVDKIATDTVREFLDSDLSRLPSADVHTIKQIDYEYHDYPTRRKIMQTLIGKVIYTENKLTFYIHADANELKSFTSENYINQKSAPADFIIDGEHIIIQKPVILNKGISSNRYNTGAGGLMTITENNHLIIRAFAVAHKYKERYEKYGNMKEIMKTEKTAERNVYRYLNLAYLDPKVVNDVMGGKIQISVDELFKLSKI